MSPIGRIFGQGRAVESLLKKANVAFGKEDWETSSQIARELLERINPAKPGKFSHGLLRAYYLKAASLYKLGKTDLAIDVIKEALGQDDGLGDIAKLLAGIAGLSDDPRFIDILEAFLKKVPDNNFIALTLADKYVDSGRFDDKAVALFKKVYQRTPDNKKVIYGLAMGLGRQEKFDRNSLAIYRRAFHENSANNEILYALAKTYSSQNPPVSEALPVIERALKFFPDEKPFTEAKISILASLPALSPDQVKILLITYKKSKDPDLALKLVNHLLAMHADDNDACAVYETVWRKHPKKTTLLSILAERYRLAGRTDPVAVEIYQSFFDEMPRERENSFYLARYYARKKDANESAILVYQQALRDIPSGELNDIVIALATAYLATGRKDEESARIYRTAYEIDGGTYSYLVALRDVAKDGGRMDGPRANPLIKFIQHPETKEQDAKSLAKLLGPVLATEQRSDPDAAYVYRLNVANKVASKEEETHFANHLVQTGEAKIGDLPMLERVFAREESNELASVLTKLYRQTGAPDEKRLNKIILALKKDPTDRELAYWALPYILNSHGDNAALFPLISELFKQGHLSGSKDIKPGVVARTATRIARDRVREGNFNEAIAVLKEAFKKEKDPILQYLLGVSYQGAGDIQTGLDIFKNLVKVNSRNPAFSYRIAVLNMLGGDIQKARQELEGLATVHPHHPMVCLRMGLVNESEGDLNAANAEYLKVTSGDNKVVAFAAYRRGIIECARGNWEQGLQLLDSAAGGGIKTPVLDESRLVARMVLVDLDLKKESLDSSEQNLNTLTQEKRQPWLQATVERLLRLALIHFKKGDEQSARRALETAEATGILDSRVSSLIAALDITSGRPKAAIERMERALGYRDKSGNKLAHRLWTIIALRLGRHDDAREAAEWLIARKQPDAVKLRFLGVWRNPIEVDWPGVLDGYRYEDLENQFGFPVGMIGRMAYKRADYAGGAKYLETYYKDQSKPDRIEAEFLLGLMYIKLKKPNLGLHYWSHILAEGYKELKGRQRADGLLLLGYHFLEHGEPDKSREAFKLAGEAGASEDEIQKGIAYSHLQAGYLAAKSENLLGAVQEWEKILAMDPDNWQAIQNLGLAHVWIDNMEKALNYFETLFSICQEKPEKIDEEYHSFIFEETRKMINQLVNIRGTEQTRGEVKTEMLLDEIKSSNSHYWTLGVKKGATAEEAQAQYFRLIKIYNPEKYPQDFMILEKAYEFFAKPGLLRKNEQVVFNAFHFRQLSDAEAGGLSEIPPSPQIVEHLRRELDPRNHVDYDGLLKDSLEADERLPKLNTSPDFNVPDYLASW